MKIFLTTPTLQGRHGGIRILCEIANRLQDLGHEVTLYNLGGHLTCDWFDVKVRITNSTILLKKADCLIITSPHTIHLQKQIRQDQKCFLHCQMMEHLFNIGNKRFYDQCIEFYTSPHPMFSISQWNMQMMKELGRTAPTHYIGNGVNLEHFPISDKPKDGKTVLVEGWECTNQAKDVDNIAPKVAKRLKEEGYYIIAYSAQPLKTMPDVPHEYHCKPSLEKMNELYERATILLKASKYDARSCAPVEAMTKGTATARVIQFGDDDLIDEYNCLRDYYNQDRLYLNSLQLLKNVELRKTLSKNCLQYVQTECNWQTIMNQINEILCS